MGGFIHLKLKDMKIYRNFYLIATAVIVSTLWLVCTQDSAAGVAFLASAAWMQAAHGKTIYKVWYKNFCSK